MHSRPGLKDLPRWSRPRERLRALGSDALSDRELLAIVLGSASRRHSVLAVAEGLLPGEGQLEQLARMGLDELSTRPGLGEAGACRVVALVELCRRMGRARSRAGLPLTSAAAVHELFRGRLAGSRREQVFVVMLDARRRWIAERCVSTGSLMSSIIHPREVFWPAIELASASVVLVHNHPSGDPTPSAEDHQVTLRLQEAGALLGIPLLDQVVVAAEGYRSFREEGWLDE